MNRATANSQTRTQERRGNAWSGAVAMVLLGLFAIALISSEMDADRATDGANPSVPAIIAGQ